MRDKAVAELERVGDEIEALEASKEQPDAFLGLNETSQRAGHGKFCNFVFEQFQKARDLYRLPKSKTCSKGRIRG